MKKILSIIFILLSFPLFIPQNTTMACNPGCNHGGNGGKTSSVSSTASSTSRAIRSIAQEIPYIGMGVGMAGVAAVGSLYIANKISGLPKLEYGKTEWTNLSVYGLKLGHKKSDLSDIASTYDNPDSLIASAIKTASNEDGFINVSDLNSKKAPANIYLITDSQIQDKTIHLYSLNIPKELKDSNKITIKTTFRLKTLDGTKDLSNSKIDLNLFKDMKTDSIIKDLTHRVYKLASGKTKTDTINDNTIQREFTISDKAVISGNKPVILTVSYQNLRKSFKDDKNVIYAGVVDIENVQ